MDDPAPRPLPFQRILLKLSGGFLGDDGHVLDRPRLDFIASQLRPVLDAGVRVGIVTGGEAEVCVPFLLKTASN